MEVMVVGVGRVMELDEGLSGEQGVMVLDRESRVYSLINSIGAAILYGSV